MSIKFNIWTNEAIDNTGVSSNGEYELLNSGPLDNNGDYNSLRLVVEYKDILPEDDAIANSFYLTAVVEASNGLTGASEAWFPIAYQFRGYRKAFQGTIREIILQPNLVVIDQGVDDVTFVGNETKARISRQQGKLPDTDWRVRVLLTEEGHGGPGAFASGKITVYGERFNV